MNQLELHTLSVQDVLHTLRECDRNERYQGMFEHMLTFASELTGLSEDTLLSSMYDLSVESWKDMQYKYPLDRDKMDEEEEDRFVKDCFRLYEKEGFSPVYWSPFTDYEERQGQPFTVVRQCTEEDCDLGTLPMWKIQFSDGAVIDAYPEEIIPSEMRANGCPWLIASITLDTVQAGYASGIIKLIKSPNGDGVACRIGDGWFYFGGPTAEEFDDVEAYKQAIPEEDIAQEIYAVLKQFSTAFPEEYRYYALHLRAQGLTNQECKESKDVEPAKGVVRNIAIVKRTFEGKNKPEANNNPVTSKYYPSRKYAVMYELDGYAHNPIVHCCTTKKECQTFIAQLHHDYTVEESVDVALDAKIQGASMKVNQSDSSVDSKTLKQEAER